MINEEAIREAVREVYLRIRKRHKLKIREIWKDEEDIFQLLKRYVPDNLPRLIHNIEIYSNEKKAVIGLQNALNEGMIFNSRGNLLHWTTCWNLMENGKGFSLEAFKDSRNEIRWEGQYLETNTIKYHELIQSHRDIFELHYKTLLNLIQKKMGIYLPCIINDDMFSGELLLP